MTSGIPLVVYVHLLQIVFGDTVPYEIYLFMNASLLTNYITRVCTSEEGGSAIIMGDAAARSGGRDLAEQTSRKTSELVQSSKHRDLLDIVDSLRSNGVSH